MTRCVDRRNPRILRTPNHKNTSLRCKDKDTTGLNESKVLALCLIKNSWDTSYLQGLESAVA